MFDEKQIQAYRSLAAPAEQRRRVLNMAAEQEEPKPFFATAAFRSLSAAAACLALVFALTVLNPGPSGPEFSLDGRPITAEAVTLPQNTQIAALSHARDLSVIALPLEADFAEETLLSASCGTLSAKSRTTEEILFEGRSGTVTGPVLLTWSVPQEGQFPCTLTADSPEGLCTITLAFDAAENGWTVRCSVE